MSGAAVKQTASAKTSGAFRVWVIVAGVYNILNSFAMMVPFLNKSYYRMLSGSSRMFGGAEILPAADPVNMLFVNTAGLVLVLVGAMLLYAARDLKNRSGIPLLNAVARTLWALLVIYYTIAQDLPRLFLTFAAVDIIFAAAFFYYVSKAKDQ
jgi:hypothetical protein